MLLRLSVFLVMFAWTIDKFVQPQHAAGIMEHFYSLSGVGHAAIYILAALELALLLAFVAGVAKRWTCGIVLVLHGISTFSAHHQYLHPFTAPDILFFAAWPMLAACFALYFLREDDVLWTLKTSRETPAVARQDRQNLRMSGFTPYRLRANGCIVAPPSGFANIYQRRSLAST